jgi:tyrosine-protein kinase Etk/Wzc
MSAELRETNLLDYAYVLLKWRRLIITSFIVVSVAAAGVSFILPEKWTADTKLLPPEDEGADQFGLSMLLGSAVPAGLMGLVGGSTPAERLVTFLESRLVLGAVVDKFDLVSMYEAPYRSHAIETLNEQVEKELERDGTLVLSVTAATPKLAAALANALVSELDSVNRDYKRRQAKALREFLADRLALTHRELKSHANKLRQFQELHGLVDVEAQTNAAVELTRNVAQQLIELKVQLQLLTRTLSPESEERHLLEVEVDELSKQLKILLGGDGGAERGSSEGLESLGPPLRELPELLVEHTELALELELRSELILVLGTKFEEAKYREALNTPTLQILDPAIPPQARSAPRRALIVVSSALASLLLSTLFAFAMESWARLGVANETKLQAIRELMGRR